MPIHAEKIIGTTFTSDVLDYSEGRQRFPRVEKQNAFRALVQKIVSEVLTNNEIEIAKGNFSKTTKSGNESLVSQIMTRINALSSGFVGHEFDADAVEQLIMRELNQRQARRN